MDSDYIAQIDIDPIAKDNEYDFTTEKEICDADTTDSEQEEADDRNTSDIFDEYILFFRFNGDVFPFF